MADWWARHTDGGASSSVEEALTTHADEEVVEDTLSAFRTALRRADGIESAADLHGEAANAQDEEPSASLDYFAPAFRQALGREERHTDTHAAETEGTAQPEGKTPEESLNYFAPALPGASGQDEQADPVRGAFVEMGEEMSEDTEETEAPEHSLDYFAPAFRRALGDDRHPDPDPNGARVSDETRQGAVAQLKEVIEGMSERGLVQLSGLKRSELSGFDLDRLTERFSRRPLAGSSA